MTLPLPSSLPESHRRFLNSALEHFQRDARLLGVAAGGSFLSNSMDEFSDLDLVIATEPTQQGQVLADRRRIAGSLGPLLSAFTGEHVGEPRLLICLYEGESPLHVDLKFVALPDLAQRVEDPAILWEREGALTRALESGTAVYPAPDAQWIEDRFWVWVHYTAAKIGRAELFEAVAAVSFLRERVLGPLALVAVGARPSGVRRLERYAPEYVAPLRATLAGYDAPDCMRALFACVDLYRALRGDAAGLERREGAERAAVKYLAGLRPDTGAGRRP